MKPNYEVQLKRVVLFLIDNGIVSMAKLAKIMGISLYDFHLEYLRRDE